MTYDLATQVAIAFILNVRRNGGNQKRNSEAKEDGNGLNLLAVAGWSSLGGGNPDQWRLDTKCSFPNENEGYGSLVCARGWVLQADNHTGDDDETDTTEAGGGHEDRAPANDIRQEVTREDSDVIKRVQSHNYWKYLFDTERLQEGDDVVVHVGRTLCLLERLDANGDQEASKICSMHEIGPARGIFSITILLNGKLNLVNVLCGIKVVGGCREEALCGGDGIIRATVQCYS